MEGFQNRNNMSVWVNVFIKFLQMPGAVSIIGAKTALTTRGRRLLEGILNISKRDNKAKGSGESKEESRAWLCNA